MIFRAQFAVGAVLFFQSIAIGSDFVRANDVEETQNLRRRTSEGEDLSESEERELQFNYQSGRNTRFGYTSSNNRFSQSRARGNTLGSNLLRPYAPVGSQVYNPNQSQNQLSKVGKSTKGAVANKIGKASNSVNKASKNHNKNHNKNSKAHNKNAKAHKSAKYATNNNQLNQNNDSQALPQRGGSYLNAMNWQRVPGQPIFVSANDVPIIILDEQPIVVFDIDGNAILLDQNGNEIVITIDESGQPVVQIEGSETEAPTGAPSEAPVVAS